MREIIHGKGMPLALYSDRHSIFQVNPQQGESLEDRYSYARARVELQERLDGSLVVLYQGMVIATTEAPPHPVTLRARKGTPGQPEDNSNNNLVDSLSPNGAQPVHEAPSHQADIQPGYHKPPPSHPWRKPVVTKSLNR